MAEDLRPGQQPGCSAASLFDIAWEAMVDVLGNAATATLFRRSIKRASERTRELEGVMIRRETFEYAYKVPDHWREPRPEDLLALRELAKELAPLLIELTGPVVVRRLNAIHELKRCGIVFEEHDS
jgi:hypothetical protein